MLNDISMSIKAMMDNNRDRASMISPHNRAYSKIFIKPGHIFLSRGHYYQAVEAPLPGNCKGCDFLEGGICQRIPTTKEANTTCSGYTRTDGTWLVFHKVTKEEYLRSRNV